MGESDNASPVKGDVDRLRGIGGVVVEVKDVGVSVAVELAGDCVRESFYDPPVLLAPGFVARFVAGRYVGDDVHRFPVGFGLLELADQPLELIERILVVVDEEPVGRVADVAVETYDPEPRSHQNRIVAPFQNGRSRVRRQPPRPFVGDQIENPLRRYTARFGNRFRRPPKRVPSINRRNGERSAPMLTRSRDAVRGYPTPETRDHRTSPPEGRKRWSCPGDFPPRSSTKPDG